MTEIADFQDINKKKNFFNDFHKKISVKMFFFNIFYVIIQ